MHGGGGEGQLQTLKAPARGPAATCRRRPAPPPRALPQGATPDQLLTDRSSYITYLESQLERVSAACLTVSSFDERIEQAASSVAALQKQVRGAPP